MLLLSLQSQEECQEPPSSFPKGGILKCSGLFSQSCARAACALEMLVLAVCLVVWMWAAWNIWGAHRPDGGSTVEASQMTHGRQFAGCKPLPTTQLGWSPQHLGGWKRNRLVKQCPAHWGSQVLITCLLHGINHGVRGLPWHTVSCLRWVVQGRDTLHMTCTLFSEFCPIQPPDPTKVLVAHCKHWWFCEECGRKLLLWHTADVIIKHCCRLHDPSKSVTTLRHCAQIEQGGSYFTGEVSVLRLWVDKIR
jgi:hypothetical protein